MRCRATLRGWKQTDSEAGLQPRPQHHLFGRGPSAPVARPMMKCQLVIVPAKHPHLRGEGGKEDGGGRELTGREMTPWIPPSFTLFLIQFIFLSVFFLLFSCSRSGYQAVVQAQGEYSAMYLCIFCTFNWLNNMIRTGLARFCHGRWIQISQLGPSNMFIQKRHKVWILCIILLKLISFSFPLWLF